MIEWEDLALETAERFGGTMPHPETAKTIAAVYAKAPTAVQRAIDRVATDYENGGIRSPWGVLKTRVQQITVDQATNAKGNDREKALARAEQWVRTTGIHYDRETEILDELYGERGPLQQHPDTQTRILALWQELRPIGELLEQQADERGRNYAAQRQTEAANKRELELKAQAAPTPLQAIQ